MPRQWRQGRWMIERSTSKLPRDEVPAPGRRTMKVHRAGRKHRIGADAFVQMHIIDLSAAIADDPELGKIH